MSNTSNLEKCILVDGSHPEELRVAIVARQANGKYHLENLHMQRATQMSSKGNIYGGISTTLVESLNAAFVDIGSTRHAFLPQKEIALQYFKNPKTDLSQRTSITDLIKENQKLLVQVEKDERGNKGAALTTFISLAGCYLVLMPNNPRAGGISRRIEGEEREELKSVLDQLDVPDGMGLIVRTAGVGKSVEELQWDLSVLLKQWEAIQTASESLGDSPALVYQESNIVVRTIRDYLRSDISQIITNDEKIFEELKQNVSLLKPEFANQISLHQDSTPLFNRYQVEGQIETAYQRDVRLPSGGSIVIDHTEALVSIDINSSRATKGSDIEETALQTNLEAADEIARQLRLRDIGGLLVIDFIDMTPIRNQREVENRLREALKQDRARVQIGRISRFGLLEMSRQRLAHSLSDRTKVVCPRCKGQGTIRSVDSMAISMVRLIEEEAIKIRRQGRHDRILVQLPVNVASFLTNEKRNDLTAIESEYHISVFIIPNNTMETPHYIIKSKPSSQPGSYTPPSYKMAEAQDSEQYSEDSITGSDDTQVETPLVANVTMAQTPRKEGSFIKRIFGSLLGAEDTPKTTSATSAEKDDSNKRDSNRRESDNRRRQGSGRSGGGGRRRRGGGGKGQSRQAQDNASRNEDRNEDKGEPRGQGRGRGRGRGRGQNQDQRQQGQGRGQNQDQRQQGQGREQNQDQRQQGQGRGQNQDQRQQGQGRGQNQEQRQQGQSRGQQSSQPQKPKHGQDPAAPKAMAQPASKADDQFELQPPLDFQERVPHQPVLTSHELGESQDNKSQGQQRDRRPRGGQRRQRRHGGGRPRGGDHTESTQGQQSQTSAPQQSSAVETQKPATPPAADPFSIPSVTPKVDAPAKPTAPAKPKPAATAEKPATVATPKPTAPAKPAPAEQKKPVAGSNWEIPPEYKRKTNAPEAASTKSDNHKDKSNQDN